MKTLNNNILRLAIASLAVWATACSEVAFTPGPDVVTFEVPNTEQKETFTLNDDAQKAKVDVLFVVDNSGSMLEEQTKLGSALQSFINSLGNVDWQIGITTTDVSDGPYGLKGSLLPMAGSNNIVLNSRMIGYPTTFLNTVIRPELVNCKNTPDVPCPSGDERAMEAISMALAKRNSANSGFFRTGADLAIVILSDEDEQSTGPVGAYSPAAVVNDFALAFGTTKSLSTYGIVIEPGDSACFTQQLPSGGSYGTFAAELARLTNGVTGSICDTDYGPSLATIGSRVKNMIKTITLRYTPDPATVQVTLTPADASVTWDVVGNTIRFNKLPVKGTRVDVKYMPLQP